MTSKRSEYKNGILWRGRPWIGPSIAARTMTIVIIAATLAWLETGFHILEQKIYGIPTILWMYLALFIVWLASLGKPISIRASQQYILREDNLEVETGIVGKKSVTLSPIGFSDLELKRSFTQRLLNVGDIVVRTDSGREVKLDSVKDSVHVTNMIRDVMSKPSVRFDHEDYNARASRT